MPLRHAGAVAATAMRGTALETTERALAARSRRRVGVTRRTLPQRTWRRLAASRAKPRRRLASSSIPEKDSVGTATSRRTLSVAVNDLVGARTWVTVY